MSGGIDDADRERMAAFLSGDGPTHPNDLLADGEVVQVNNAGRVGEKTHAVADHLRERLTVGESLVTRSAHIGQAMDESAESAARSMAMLVDGGVPGLVVTRDGYGGVDESMQWRVERVEERDR